MKFACHAEKNKTFVNARGEWSASWNGTQLLLFLRCLRVGVLKIYPMASQDRWPFQSPWEPRLANQVAANLVKQGAVLVKAFIGDFLSSSFLFYLLIFIFKGYLLGFWGLTVFWNLSFFLSFFFFLLGKFYCPNWDLNLELPTNPPHPFTTWGVLEGWLVLPCTKFIFI